MQSDKSFLHVVHAAVSFEALVLLNMAQSCKKWRKLITEMQTTLEIIKKQYILTFGWDGWLWQDENYFETYFS